VVPSAKALDALYDNRLIIFHGSTTANSLFQLAEAGAMRWIQDLAAELDSQ
jgi:hypothetical protein